MAKLWPVPLLAGLLPLAATTIAYALAVHAGQVPECNPLLEGCVSISRTARQGPANVVFRALVLPAAVLQALCWLLALPWLRSQGVAPGRSLRALPVLGTGAAIALVLYASCLGVEGEGWRAVRRVAIPLYFGLTCICMIVVARHAWRALARRVAAGLLAACLCLPLLGLAHVFLPLVLPTEGAKDALENITEWWAGAIFTAFFFALAWACVRTTARFELHTGEGA